MQDLTAIQGAMFTGAATESGCQRPQLIMKVGKPQWGLFLGTHQGGTRKESMAILHSQLVRFARTRCCAGQVVACASLMSPTSGANISMVEHPLALAHSRLEG